MERDRQESGKTGARAVLAGEGSLWPPLLLVLAFLAVTVLTNWWIYRRNASTLDDDLGLRLRNIAGLLVDTHTVTGDDLYAPGSGLDLDYLGVAGTLLRTVQERYDLDAILLLEPDSLKVAWSSRPELHPHGSRYAYRTAHEAAILEAVLQERPTASRTIRIGQRGQVYLKSGFVPVKTVLQDELVAVLVVEASADFLEVLGTLRGAMLTGLLVSAALVVLLAAAYVGLQRRTIAARRSLERENRLAVLGRMASQVAHEIRNPIGIIKYSSERLARWLDQRRGGTPESDPELSEMVSYIQEETQRLKEVTERYLTYARDGQVRSDSLEPAELLRSAATALERMGLPEGVQIEVEAPEGLPQIHGDRNLLRQVLLNLAQNALDAVGRTGRLRLFARSEPGRERILLGVEDDGPGIPEREKDRVFEAFYSTRPEGNGLGLYTVAQTAVLHGGSAHAEDREEGGARVYVRLPLAPAARD